MGREIRRVPADWEHPKDEKGEFIPLYDKAYIDALEAWIEEHRQWMAGTHPRRHSEFGEKYEYFAQYDGDPPRHESYRLRTWTEEEATHYQMYETVSEGTPLSPHFATKEELARWLATNKDYWGKGPVDYATAQRFVEAGWVPSFMVDTSRGVIAEGLEIVNQFGKDS